MDETVLSEEWRGKLFNILEDYIDNTEDSSGVKDPTKIHQNMWLSVIEMCQRNGRLNLG